MKISYHLYQLPIQLQFPRSSHIGKGALISIKYDSPTDDQNIGYADLHPWPSKGDLNIEEQLKKLRSGNPNQQTLISINCARRDLLSKDKQLIGVNFLSEIKNHILIVKTILNIENLEGYLTKVLGPSFCSPPSTNEIENHLLNKLPFDDSIPLILKYKISPQLLSNTIALINLTTIKYPFIRWRLDSNSLLSFNEMLSFWNELTPSSKIKIEFIEDPCPYQRITWTQLEEEGLPLAIDFEINQWLKLEQHESPTPSKKTIFTLKPAIQDISWWISYLKQYPHSFFVTSYLDHPIGMLHALWSAEEMYQQFPKLILTCGLSLPILPASLSQFWKGLYQDPSKSNSWSGEKDFGIGFSSQLRELKWTNLGDL